jgi:hypothetical protein
MAGYVERGEIPGIVALVTRGDDVHLDVVGTLAFGTSAPVRRAFNLKIVRGAA